MTHEYPGGRKSFLVINPGSTGTKTAIYRGSSQWDLTEEAQASLDHDSDISSMEPIDQLNARLSAVENFLQEHLPDDLAAVAGRGGLTRPLEAGSYGINDGMIRDLSSARYGNHASNLGALMARRIAEQRKIPSLIADPVGVDQFEPPARYSGWPGLERKCQLHALNMRSVAREAARDMGGVMEDFNFIIAHLGGGISIGPMTGGRIIDVNNAMDGGPFSPQRCGTLPLTGLIDICFSGEYRSAGELKKALTRTGGLNAYLGTDDAREVMRRIQAGDGKAEEVYRAMAYQISKEIGAMAAVLKGRVDAIILTGGLPRPPLSDWIEEHCSWIAGIRIYPGEMELLALARAAARHVFDGEALLDY